MLFTNSKSFRNITIAINNVSIKQLNSARFFEDIYIYIYDKMKWKDHISDISNKLAKCMSILHRVTMTFDS